MRFLSRLLTGLIGMVAGVVVALSVALVLQLIETPSLQYLEYTVISFGLTGFLIGFVVGRGRATSSSDAQAQPTMPVARRFRWRVIPVVILAALGLLLTAGGLSSLWNVCHVDRVLMPHLLVCEVLAIVAGAAWILAAFAFMRSQRLYGWISSSTGLVLFAVIYAIGIYMAYESEVGGSEPISRSPQYCWLVFGPKADLRLLVCRRGRIVTIDRDGECMFSGSEGQWKNVVVADPQHRTTYTIGASQYVFTPGRSYVLVSVSIKGSLECDQYCNVELASDPHGAKEAHFHGTLTVGAATDRLPPI